MYVYIEHWKYTKIELKFNDLNMYTKYYTVPHKQSQF